MDPQCETHEGEAGDKTMTFDESLREEAHVDNGDIRPRSRDREPSPERSRSRSRSRPRGSRDRSQSPSHSRSHHMPRGRRERSDSSMSRPEGKRQRYDSRSPSVSSNRDHYQEELSDDDYEAFMPSSSKNKSQWQLSRRIAKTAESYFTRHFTADDMKGLIEELPIPRHEFLLAPEMDDDLKSYFVNKAGKEAVIARDANWQHVENKLKKTMGPLGKLWEATDKARKGDVTAIKAEELLRLVEKSALFLGQAAQSLTYYRRMDVLFQIMKKKEDIKKALKNHGDKLPVGDKLFGKDFQTAVLKDKTEIGDLASLAKQEDKRKQRQEGQQKGYHNPQSKRGGHHQGYSRQQYKQPQQYGWAEGGYPPFYTAQAPGGTTRHGPSQQRPNYNYKGRGTGSTRKPGQAKPPRG